jgi:hypothetical protein
MVANQIEGKTMMQIIAGNNQFTRVDKKVFEVFLNLSISSHNLGMLFLW